MIAIPGYQITQEIITRVNTIIYRAIRERDLKPVILKILTSDYPSLEEVSRLKHEYEIARNLNIDGIVQPLSLENYQNRWALVLEDMGGVSLKQFVKSRKLTLEQFLNLAIQLSDTLGKLHQNQIIHKDITPYNIIINPTNLQVKIADFSIATRLSKETCTWSNSNLLEGTLPYISPEQTGRMNRSIDYRTDFYSLGVTLYEIIVGELPFTATDVLELIHCHIAKQPVAPVERNGKIPQVVSDIIIKLFSKTAEERYQSAYGLKTDLEICLGQLKTTKKVEPFILGQLDRSGQFILSQKLYGREQEVAALMDAFDRINSGKTEIVLVSGYSGVGKSCLIQEVHKPIIKARGYFIAGKFDQFNRDIPYASLIQAFQELMRQILTESEEKIAIWKHKLLDALGQNGQAIVDVIPELELIIGEQPEVTKLGAIASQNRFNRLFKQFIHVFTKPEHPLVLFLDDLQWTDSASLKLIQILMTDSDSQYLLLIGAYRDNEVAANHPLMLTLGDIQKTGASITNINLLPLNLTHINELIADTLKCKQEQSISLAKLVFKKTQGNPFFVSQLLYFIYQKDLLSFKFIQEFWHWDIEKIQHLAVTDNVIELTIEKINKLDKNTQNILKLAACIGNRFELDVLAIVNEKSAGVTAKHLWQALQEDLILPLTNKSKISHVWEQLDGVEISYKFLHDRIQQAAYSLIPDERKKEVHLKIGQLLLKNTSQAEREEKIFDIVNHLNLGAELISDSQEKAKLAELNLAAGKKAKNSNAYKAAVTHFTLAMKLLDSSWEENYNLIFELYKQRGECEYLTGSFEQAEELLTTALNKAKSKFELAEICTIYIALCMTQGKNNEAIQLGIDSLKLFGLDLPIKKEELSTAITAESQELLFNLRQTKISDLVNLPEIKDKDTKVTMNLLGDFWAAAYLANNQQWLNLCVLKTLNMTLKQGNTDVSALAYANYGMMLANQNDYKSAYEFGNLALKIAEKFNNITLLGKVNNIFAHIINPFKNHLKSNIELYLKSYEINLECGNIVWGVWAVFYSIWTRFILGENLESVYQESEIFIGFVHQTNDDNMISAFAMLQHTILNLQGLAQNKYTLNDEESILNKWKNNQFYIGIHWHGILKTQVLFMYESYADAFRIARENAKILGIDGGFFNITQHYLYDSLILTSLYPTATIEEKDYYQQILQNNLKKIELWATNCPENFLHKYLLVLAELARIYGHDLEAMELYDRAIASASENGFIQNESLANELAAKFYLAKSKIKIAKTYMLDARYGYTKWGAHAKVKDLEEKYPQLIANNAIKETTASSENHLSNSTTLSNSTALDLSAVIKASQAISSEIVLDKLLEKLMQILIETAGAQKGIIILEQEGKLVISAEKNIENQNTTLLPFIPVEASPNLPLRIIKYVERTRTSIVLDNATVEGNFTTDNYIINNQVKSILCAPIVQQQKLVGIVYLENNLTISAFTPERLEMLQLLSGQAAISLELARAMNRVQDNLAYLNTIINHIADGLLVTDVNGNIFRFNPSLLRMFNLSGTDLVGQACQGSFSSKMAALVTQTLSHPAEVITAEIELAEGRTGKAVTTAICPDNTATCIGSVTLIRDITAEKEIDQMKTDFISTVSHELRTPLTSVLGFAKIILKKLEDGIFPLIPVENQKAQKNMRQVGDNINIIIAEGERLTSLINDVLDIAKMEAGKVEWQMQPLAIEPIIDRAIAATSSLFVDKNIELHKDVTPGLPEIVGDRDRLLQVLINLISNAIKFTEQGSCTLKVKRQQNQLIISVIDTGIGISPEYHKQVFEKFKQLGDTMTDKPKGTGLGLPICKQIIEFHHGKIWVESQTQIGSNFSFTLPIVTNATAQSNKKHLDILVRQLKQSIVEATPETSQHQKTILVVDDDTSIRQLLRHELEAEGYQVKEAKDGMDAISQVKAEKPDLILLDVMMPQINGFDVAAMLKNDPSTMSIPIIILSIIEDKERGYQLGIDRYFTKPINTEELLQHISLLLSQGISKKKVMILDEDTSTVTTLSDILQERGFTVVEAFNTSDCIEQAISVKPDMIIVDSLFQDRYNLVKTLRFEKGMENIYFLLIRGDTL